MFCKHDWELISENFLESKYELMDKCIASQDVNESAFHALYDRKLVQILRCKKCGKIKKFVEIY